MAGEELRVAVFPATPEEQEMARAALLPDTVSEYPDIVEGWATREAVQRLLDANLMVDVLEARDAPAAVAPAPEPPAEALKACAELAREAPIDPRAAEVGARPDADEALSEDVYNVRLTTPITAEQRAALGEIGAEISLFEPPATYRMFLTADQYARVRGLDWVEDVTRYGLAQTVAPALVEQFANANGGRGTYDAVLHRSDDLAFVRDAIAAADGARVLTTTDSLVRFEAPRGAPLLAALAQLPAVRTLAPYQPPELHADYARRLIGVETLDAGWDGAGEVVAFFDSGVDAEHPDLKEQLVAAEAVGGLSPTDGYGHGSHVAGLIAGSGAASEGKIRGAAPGAKLVSVAVTDGRQLEVDPDLSRLLGVALEKGASIINLSWGKPLSSEYDQGATRIDKFVHDNPHVLVVVAAGNEGKAPKGYVELKTIGTPATAKNVVTVGACDSDRPDFPELTWGQLLPQKFTAPPAAQEHVAGDPNLPANNSSRGPANDYRLKPDLLAPGTCILSVRASGAAASEYRPDYAGHEGRYGYMSGTSMAAPLVAGTAAVLRQYLRAERQLEKPSAALMKAILIAAARRLPPIEAEGRDEVGFPDFDQGYGRLDLASVLPHGSAPAGRRLVFDDVANDSPDALESRSLFSDGRRAMRRYTVEVEDPGEPLRIVLAWTDYPGPSVQNNLHLDVMVPGTGRVVGNPEHRFRLDPGLDAWEGVLFDKRNNVEEVWVEDPPPGKYSIRIAAQNTVFPPQGYALVACGLVADKLERM